VVPTGVIIRLEAHRPVDGATARFDLTYTAQPQVFTTYGNVLQTSKGCVFVTVDVRSADDANSLATAKTPCLTLG
jgi:hypothetical protein